MATLFAGPATELNVVDLGDELVIESTRKPSLPGAVLSALVTGGFVAVFASRYVGIPARIVAAVFGASLVFALAKRTRKVELRVTRLELTSRGPTADDIRSVRNVSSASIQWLEYQEGASGTEGPPRGLYAVLGRGRICLLPDIDPRQTDELIDRIEAKFPALYEQRVRADPFGQHFTALRLNEPR